MAGEIEVLENIKKQEDTAEKKVKDAQEKASKIVEGAKQKAQVAMEDARKSSEIYYGQAMQKAQVQAEGKRDEILDDARAMAKRIKRVDKATVLSLFKKAVKEKMGV